MWQGMKGLTHLFLLPPEKRSVGEDLVHVSRVGDALGAGLASQ